MEARTYSSVSCVKGLVSLDQAAAVLFTPSGAFECYKSVVGSGSDVSFMLSDAFGDLKMSLP